MFVLIENVSFSEMIISYNRCNSFILPHLQYGLAAWGSCIDKNKKRIVTIQKRAVRTVCKAHANSHTEPRMKKIGMLKLDNLYTHQCHKPKST